MTDNHGWNITDSVHQLLETIPSEVTLVAAAKRRSVAEVRAAIDAGVNHIGHNYVQEAEVMVGPLNGRPQWHMIGHLQSNKSKTAAEIFDIVECYCPMPHFDTKSSSEPQQKHDKAPRETGLIKQ